MNILILGHNGMLGHMVMSYFDKQNFNISTTNLRFPNEEFKQFVSSYTGDYIINCIGAIPQKTKQFECNTDLPIWLDSNLTCKIIHPGTDCEIDNDPYGISKRNASDYIKHTGKNTKILKASIIGPELNSKFSLMEWFLNSDSPVTGYTDALWNGVTTYEWVKQCEQLMLNWQYYNTETIISSICISKYELLSIIKEVFNKKIEISKMTGVGINKCQTGSINAKDIQSQLIELKKYINKEM